MSWGIDMTGSKSGIITSVSKEMDKIAVSYEGKEEGKDILILKGRILALIEAVDLGTDGYTDWNAITVKANGSHSTSAKGISSASFSVNVTRTSLKL